MAFADLTQYNTQNAMQHHFTMYLHIICALFKQMPITNLSNFVWLTKELLACVWEAPDHTLDHKTNCNMPTNNKTVSTLRPVYLYSFL